MVVIHFVDAKTGQPLCRQPERANWLWSAFPDDVTCSQCWPLVRERRTHPRPKAAVAAV